MADTPTWTLEVDADRVAWLTCDMPESSANVLSAAVLRDLALQLDDIAARRPVGVVIRSAKQPRQNWAAAFQRMAQRGDDALLDAEAPTLSSWDDEEWEWR